MGPVRNPARSRPRWVCHRAWAALGIEQAAGDLCGVYLYAAGGEYPETHWHARMFAPHIGVPEDPATGSAAAGLPAHLLASGILEDGCHQWQLEQGFEMGRPALIQLRVEVRGGQCTGLRIGGHAVPVMRGSIELDPA